MVERAYAKINLTLEVVGKRDDGYHNIRSIMQTVSLCDYITVKKDESDAIIIKPDQCNIPTDKRNLVYKACESFFRAAGIKGGAIIEIKKHIPVAAGLAGGSSDAAATLRALNRLYKTGFSEDMLRKIGAIFGADVPYCISGGTALCEGIGDIITPLKPLPRMDLVISIGGEGMSTPAMYAKFDDNMQQNTIDTDGMLDAINKSDARGIAARLGNTFERICCEKRSFIIKIKSIMIQNGALGAVMSGSGPSVFGFFHDKEEAARCSKLLISKGYYAFYCNTINIANKKS